MPSGTEARELPDRSRTRREEDRGRRSERRKSEIWLSIGLEGGEKGKNRKKLSKMAKTKLYELVLVHKRSASPQAKKKYEKNEAHIPTNGRWFVKLQ